MAKDFARLCAATPDTFQRYATCGELALWEAYAIHLHMDPLVLALRQDDQERTEWLQELAEAWPSEFNPVYVMFRGFRREWISLSELLPTSQRRIGKDVMFTSIVENDFYDLMCELQWHAPLQQYVPDFDRSTPSPYLLRRVSPLLRLVFFAAEEIRSASLTATDGGTADVRTIVLNAAERLGVSCQDLSENLLSWICSALVPTELPASGGGARAYLSKRQRAARTLRSCAVQVLHRAAYSIFMDPSSPYTFGDGDSLDLREVVERSIESHLAGISVGLTPSKRLDFSARDIDLMCKLLRPNELPRGGRPASLGSH